MQLPFFVYGTLRPGGRNHARHLSGRCTRVVGAVLEDAALHDGPGYPYVLPAPGGRVVGELVTVHPALHARVMADLDRLEGCTPEGDGEYVRVRRAVRTADGAGAEAWVYFAGPRVTAVLRETPAPIPSGDWTDR